MTEIPSSLWHHQPISQVLQSLETDPDRGLDQDEIERRQRQYGPNVLTQKQGRGDYGLRGVP